MHTLIVGERGVGKSTLLERVLREIGRPVFGFETKKEDALRDERLGSPVYIYEPGAPRTQSETNLVGYCRNQCPSYRREGFDRYAGKLQNVPPGCIVKLDEIGFMEAASPAFCAAIMRLLDGDTPVIAAVKFNASPFLDAVRSHPNCRRFDITPENRDALYDEVLAFVRSQLAQIPGGRG